MYLPNTICCCVYLVQLLNALLNQEYIINGVLGLVVLILLILIIFMCLKCCCSNRREGYQNLDQPRNGVRCCNKKHDPQDD